MCVLNGIDDWLRSGGAVTRPPCPRSCKEVRYALRLRSAPFCPSLADSGWVSAHPPDNFMRNTEAVNLFVSEANKQ